MAWIELHQTLPRHPKLIRLATKLRIPRAQAAGHLTFLWLWCLDYSPDGNLSAFGAAELAAAADYDGDPEQFDKALKSEKWITPEGMIHDWGDYAGRLMVSRAQSKERMRNYRNRLQDVTRNGAVTNTKRAELPYHTVPNHTVPNPTEPKTSPSGTGEIASLVIPQKFQLDAFKMAWDAWMEARREKPKPKNWTKFFQRQLDWLDKKYTTGRAIDVLEFSTVSGYTGLVEPKSSSFRPSPTTKPIDQSTKVLERYAAEYAQAAVKDSLPTPVELVEQFDSYRTLPGTVLVEDDAANGITKVIKP